jgi:hypothetical protein
LREQIGNLLQNTTPIFQDVVVPEPENAPASTPEVSIPGLIDGCAMLSAVRFENQFRLDTGEIDNVGRDRMLAPETASELIVTQLMPQCPFRHGYTSAQVLTALYYRRAAAHRPHPNPPPLAGEGK